MNKEEKVIIVMSYIVSMWSLYGCFLFLTLTNKAIDYLVVLVIAVIGILLVGKMTRDLLKPKSKMKGVTIDEWLI